MPGLFLGLILALLSRPSAAGDAPCVKWGNTFDVSLESANVIRNCKLPDGRQICCAAVSNTTATRGVGANYVPPAPVSNDNGKGYCTVTKVYVSSPQELRELVEADRIDSIPGDKSSYMIEARSHALLKYVTSDEYIRNSTTWLERVRVRMSSPENLPETPVDREYLSRFEYTRTCSDRTTVDVVTKWTEWIEPIGITARHPFGFGKCRPAAPYYNANGEHNSSGKAKPRVGRSDVDYVLLQSGAALHQHAHSHTGRRFRTSKGGGGGGGGSARNSYQPAPKHFMFDAGTSTFDSSLFWFTCAYSQRGVSFDQVYGWEMTLLEPVDYWRRVPALWKPYWHFHNIPVQSDAHHADSPLRYIRQLASPQDFVAFKLDIDTPDVEIPIALMLRDDPEFFNLVDEFFFELHFRCEVMTSCGWGKRVPSETHGLQLLRSTVLRYFINLRAKSGIRAHIWP